MLRIGTHVQLRLHAKSLAAASRSFILGAGRCSPTTISRMRVTAFTSAAAATSPQQTPPQRQLPSHVYDALVAQNALTLDRAQANVLRKHLDKLHRQLDGYVLPTLPAESSAATDSRDATSDSESTSTTASDSERRTSVLVPRGLYLHGSVGTGKSMLMDLFFANVGTTHKRRVHFNAFMLEVHERIQRLKQQQLARDGRQRHIDLDPTKDAITHVADAIASESHLLCFDEFQVTDIADALIMRKLFGVFFRRGVVVVATSNTPPQSLYRDGINREYFLPFLDQLARYARVVAIATETDYRVQSATTAAGDRTFIYPLNAATRAELDRLYCALLEADDVTEDANLQVPVMMGRVLQLRGSRSGVARMSFNLLCKTEKGAADYKALCECFISALSIQHDQARRFILLIDELYEHRTRLVVSSAMPMDAMFNFDNAAIAANADATADAAALKRQQLMESKAQNVPAASSWDAPVGAYNPAKMAGLAVQNLCALQDLRVAFKRAVSRLHEMQSDKYVAQNAALQALRLSRLHDVLDAQRSVAEH